MNKILLQICIIFIIKVFNSLYQIKFLRTPKYSDIDEQISIYNINFEIEFKLNLENFVNDISIKLIFPDLLTRNFKFYWTKTNLGCLDQRRLNEGTSVSNTEEGNKVKILNLKNYQTEKINKVYIELHLEEMPGAAGYKDPILMYIVLNDSPYSQIFGYNFKDLILLKNSPIADTITIDFSPTSTITDSTQINRKYIALADITLNTECNRIQIKSSNFNFSIDSIQKCGFIYTQTTENIDINNYECIYNSRIPKLLTYITKNNYKFPKDKKLRIKLPIDNNNLPSSNDFIFLTKEKYSPIVIQKGSINSALTVNSINFKTNDPNVYLGPHLNVKSSNFPNLNLFTMGDKINSILLNSIEITFSPEINLPEPQNGTYYYLKIFVNGSTNTILLKGFIYNNFPKISSGQDILQEIDTNKKFITFKNIGGLSSYNTYSLGFKIGLHGDENLKIEAGGNDDFLGIQLLHSTADDVIISYKAPTGMNSNFRTVINYNLPTIIEPPTITHSLSTGLTDADYMNRGVTNYGIQKKDNQDFFIKSNLNPALGFTQTNTKSYLEFILNISIEANYFVSNWDSANYDDYCFLRNNLGVLKTGSIENCITLQLNRGIIGDEYNIFRMGAKNVNFWATAGQDHIFGFKRIKISKSNSFYKNDEDSTILDLYIKIYENISTNTYKTLNLGTQTLSFFDNIIVINNNILTNTNIKLINYLRQTSTDFDYKKIPNFIKIDGILDQINSNNSQNLILFFDDFSPLFINSDNFEIGCSNASRKFSIKCYFYKGINGRSCTSTRTCRNNLLKDRIEIHFSTYLVSTANAFEISLLIPIYLKMGANANFNFEIGVGKFMSNSYNKFIQLLDYKKLSPVNFPTSSPTSLTSIETNSSVINNINLIKDKLIIVDTNSLPFISQKFDSKFDIDCDSSTNNECSITNISDEYSFTFCQDDENFMSYDFEVINTQKTYDVSLTYLNCIHNITYSYTDSGNTYKKYCLWCPIRRSGLSNDSRLFNNFLAQPNGFLKWKTNTYSALSGVYPRFGLVNLTNLSLLTNKVFKPNSIINILPNPQIIYKNTKSNKFTLNFTTSTNLKLNDRIIIKANNVNPFEFIKTSNNYCYLKLEIINKTINCIATISGLEIQIQIQSDLNSGKIILDLYGINVLNLTNAVLSFKLITTSNISTASNYYFDESNNEGFKLSLTDYPDSNFLNKIKINDIKILNLDKNSITNLEFIVVWGNQKNLYMNERITINFNNASYSKTDYLSICNIYNENNFIDIRINGCNSENLSQFYFYSNIDTNTNNFKVVINNFRMFQGNSKISAKLLTDNGTTYLETLNSDLFNLGDSITIDELNSISITKKLNYLYLNPIYEINFSTSKSIIDNTSRLGLKFSLEYGDFYDNKALECYNLENEKKINLSCSFYDNFLYISGFKKIEKNIPIIINLIGIKQSKLISNSELIFATFDHGDNPNYIESKRVTVQSVNQLSVLPIINFQKVNFKSKFIREKSNIEFIFKNDSTFNSLTYLGIILEFIDIDYINYSNPLNCTLTINTNSENLIQNCDRFGNLIKGQITTNISANSLMKFTLNNIINPEQGGCDIKYPTIFNYNSNFNIISLSLGIFLNMKYWSLEKDSMKTYIDWKKDENGNVNINMGLINKINLIVENNWVFDQDFIFSLDKKYNGTLIYKNNSIIENIDSYIGYKYYPFYIGSNITTSNFGKYILKINYKEIYENKMVPKIPTLPLLIKKEKKRINIPTEIIVFRGHESLPIIIKFDLPFVEKIKFSIKIFSSDKFTNFVIKNNTTMLEYGPNNLIDQIIIKSNHKIVGNQIFQENTKLIVTPLNNSIYNITESKLILKDLSYNIGNNFSLNLNNLNNYSLNGKIKTDTSIVWYYYFIPEIWYINFEKNKIIEEYFKSNYSSNYIYFGIKNFDRTLKETEFNLCYNCLLSGEKYVFKYYKKSIFEFLNIDINNFINKLNNTNNTNSTNSTNNINNTINATNNLNNTNNTNNINNTNNTNNILIKIPNFLGLPSYENITKNFNLDSLIINQNNKKNKTINDYISFSTLKNNASMGSYRIEFESPLRRSMKKQLICLSAIYLAYSFENLWTEDDINCDGKLKTRDDLIFEKENKNNTSINIITNNTNINTNTNNNTIANETSSLNTTLNSNTTSNTNTTANTTLSTNITTSLNNTLNTNTTSNTNTTANTTSSTNITSSTNTTLNITGTDVINNELNKIDPLDTSPIVNILLMRNNKFNQLDNQFERLNSLISNINYNNFLIKNIEKLPKIKSVSILISNENSNVIVNQHCKIEIFSNKTGILVNSLNLKTRGSVYFYLIENNLNNNDYVNYYIIRRALIKNNNEFGNGIFGKRLNIYNITENIEFSIHDLKVDKYYKLFYYLINQDKGIFAKFSPIYKINFIIRGNSLVINKSKILIINLIFIFFIKI